MVFSHSLTWMCWISLLLLAVHGFPTNRDKIPNGYNVPNPCFPATIWNGVGHREKLGGGTLNPFGAAFLSNSQVWNAAICQADSDNDGLTNGYELGDEHCAWTPANPTTLRQTDLSHPGICDPVGSPQCASQNSWLKCTKDFVCPQVNDSAVRNITLRFPNTTVPLRETTYLCINFLLPNDTDYDIIATRPVVDNTIVVHHMVLAGCTGPVPVDNQPFDCMENYSGPCTKLIGLRNVGLPGNCLSDNYGYRIGPSGYQYAAIQIHYTNFEMKRNLFDQSGMLIYYTPRLRPHRAAVTTFGQEYINIPPLQSLTVQSTCSSGCTSHLNHSLYIQSVFLHMHLLGVSGTIELYRGGSLFKLLDNESDYDYGNLNLIEFIEPVVMLPGDEFKVRCDYKSIRQNVTVFGESTYDEMCYGFIGYWDPIEEGFDQCEQYKTSELCGLSPTKVTNCTLSSFKALYANLPNVCDSTCNDTCLNFVKAMVDTGCVDCDTGEYLYLDFGFSTEKLNLIHLCRNQLNVTQPCPTVQKPSPKSAVQILKTSADLVLVFTMWIMVNLSTLLVN